MKRQYLFVILFAVCLAGCSLGEVIQESTNISQTAQSTIATTTATPTEFSTTPTETQSLPTQLTQDSTIPTQVVVQPEPDDEDFVRVKTYIQDIFVDLRYATDDNFTHEKIYDFSDVWLRYGTVKKLLLVQEELKQSGLYLKIWDGFRPPSAQFKLWDVCPNPTYVSDPNNGFSSHSRGNTVDITLCYADGSELTMPTGFDDFSELADRDYSDCSKEAAENAQFLEQLMKKHGFKVYFGEWWHYTDVQIYSVEHTFEPVNAGLYLADCNEYISLRARPSTSADVITRISVGEQFLVVAKCGDFAMVEYQNLFGYVLFRYAKPTE